MKLLGGLNRSDFLENYWQKRPLLIANAFENFSSPLSSTQLYTLAATENIESRLIQTANKDKPWSIQYGPFTSELLQNLPASHWTLLVQSVDHHIHEVAELLESFDFIPSWRVDDVMLSLASDQGSVGPHIDNYDVFLLQAHGQRSWSINDNTYSEEDFIPDLDFKVLQDFVPEQSWKLSAGDMLYLPPNIAHHGVAIGDDCITISIGFRAPDFQELLMCYLDDWHSRHATKFYSDPQLELQANPGEITAEHIESVKHMLMATLQEDEQFYRWFGQYITSSFPYQEHAIESIEYPEFEILFKQSANLKRYGDVRINFILQSEHIDLFIQGEHFTLENHYLEFAQYLSFKHTIDYQDIVQMKDHNQLFKLLWDFYSASWFYFDE